MLMRLSCALLFATAFAVADCVAPDLPQKIPLAVAAPWPLLYLRHGKLRQIYAQNNIRRL
jgi:hypothetical protein